MEFSKEDVQIIVQRIKIAIAKQEPRMKMKDFYEKSGVSSSLFSQWNTGAVKPTITSLGAVARAIGVEYDALIDDLPSSKKDTKSHLQPPTVTEDIVTFSVMGTVAAGYDYVIYEDYTGDTVDVARSALRGHTEEDFFVLRIVGQSMYPQYHEGDFILVLRQETVDYFGQVGVVLYDDDKVTLKCVKYSQEKNQIELTPLNPQYAPVTLRGEALDHCRILGVPKLLIREING